MKWIEISPTLEIMQDPVMEAEFGAEKIPVPMPARAMTHDEAAVWAKSRGFRLPTEEEWLLGWGRMNHWGLYEWTSSGELRGGGWVNYPRTLPVSYRYWNLRFVRLDVIGFRCVRDKKQGA